MNILNDKNYQTTAQKFRQADKIINCEIDIKLEQFTERKHDSVLKNTKNRKAAILNGLPH